MYIWRAFTETLFEEKYTSGVVPDSSLRGLERTVSFPAIYVRRATTVSFQSCHDPLLGARSFLVVEPTQPPAGYDCYKLLSTKAFNVTPLVQQRFRKSILSIDWWKGQEVYWLTAQLLYDVCISAIHQVQLFLSQLHVSHIRNTIWFRVVYNWSKELENNAKQIDIYTWKHLNIQEYTACGGAFFMKHDVVLKRSRFKILPNMALSVRLRYIDKSPRCRF